MAFGKQLRADQDSWFTFVYLFNEVRHCSLAPCRVSIDSQYREFGESCFKSLFDSLGAETNGRDMLTSAGLTAGDVAMHGTAVVADQGVLLQVVGETGITAPALGDPVAG